MQKEKNGLLARLDMHVNTINTLGWLATVCVCTIYKSSINQLKYPRGGAPSCEDDINYTSRGFSPAITSLLRNVASDVLGLSALLYVTFELLDLRTCRANNNDKLLAGS